MRMGLFGRKPQPTQQTVTSAPARSGWKAQCGPLCGFLVQDHDKEETAQILLLHLKQTHKTNLSQAEALAALKPVTL